MAPALLGESWWPWPRVQRTLCLEKPSTHTQVFLHLVPRPRPGRVSNTTSARPSPHGPARRARAGRPPTGSQQSPSWGCPRTTVPWSRGDVLPPPLLPHRTPGWAEQGQWLLKAGCAPMAPHSPAQPRAARPSAEGTASSLSPSPVGSAQLAQAAHPLRHPPGRDEVQQPVGPDLLDATVRDSTHVGQVELLVPAEVILVSPAVWQWGAEGRMGVQGISPAAGPTEQPQQT